MSEQSATATTSGGAGDGKHFRHWEAVINLQPIVAPKPLGVSGEYFLDRRCGSVGLRKAIPQGIVSTELILEVIPEGAGDGGWEKANESFEAEKDQYQSVLIRDEGGNTVSMKVREIH